MTLSNNFAWPSAFIIGSLLTISLFLILPKLGRMHLPTPPTVITLDFIEWQEPVIQKKPEVKAKPKPKPKPEPKKVVKKDITPAVKKAPPQVKKPLQTKPLEKPVLTEKPVDLPVKTPPKPAEPVAEAPTPIKEKVEDIIPEKIALPTPTPIFQLTSMPRMIHREIPEYPPAMHAQGREAKVKLEVLIDAKGEIRKITVVKSVNNAFDKAAIEAISKSKFTPGNVEGKPVAVLLRIPVNFKLR